MSRTSLTTMILTWACLHTAAAGTLVMDVTLNAALKQDHMALEVLVANRGDDTAQVVAPEVYFMGKRYDMPMLEALEPQTTYLQSIRLPIPAAMQGWFVAAVNVHYSDRDGNHYSIPHLAELARNAPNDRPITLAVEQDGGGMLTRYQVHLTNHTDRRREVDLLLVAPAETGTPVKPMTVTLEPGQGGSYDLRLGQQAPANVTGKKAYVIAAMADGDVHYSVHQGLEPGSGESPVQRLLGNTTVVQIALLVMLAVVVAAMAGEWLRRRKA